MTKQSYIVTIVVLVLVLIGGGYWILNRQTRLASENINNATSTGGFIVATSSDVVAASPRPSTAVGLPNTGGSVNATVGVTPKATVTPKNVVTPSSTPIPVFFPTPTPVYIYPTPGYIGTNATIQALSQIPVGTSFASQQTIPLVRFRVTAPAGNIVQLNDLVLGSPVGNEVFNYVENIKANVNGVMIPVWFSNRYVAGTTLWSLETPLLVAPGNSVDITIYGDLKPGVRNATFTTSLKGVQGNVPITGGVEGPTIRIP